MLRTLAPELLDSLPPEDPGAIASRRDLRFINRLMGNFRWLQRRLVRVPASGMILEPGAGDGTLAQKLCAAIPGLAPRYHALDTAPSPPGWPAQAVWHRMNLESAEASPLLEQATVVIANLVLHHFTADALRRLGAQLTGCTHLLACEPWRKAFPLRMSTLLHPFLHPVTRHDMTVSIRAGFTGNELAEALGLEPADWHCETSGTLCGAYRLAAVRK